MGETTAQVTLDGYTNPSLGLLASQAYVQEQIAAAIATQVGSQTIVPNLGSVARTLSALTGDAYNLKNLGALLDGSVGDQTTIQSIRNALPNGATVDVPVGIWPSGFSPTNASGTFVLWRFMGGISGLPGYIGDGDIVQVFGNGTIQYYQQFINNNNSRELMQLNQTTNYAGTSYGELFSALCINSTSGATSQGNMTPLAVNTNSRGVNGYGSFDVGVASISFRYGTNWGWAGLFQQTDVSGNPANGNLYGVELDIFAAGTEAAASAYDCTAGLRTICLLQGEQISSWQTWQPGSGGAFYHVGDIVTGVSGGVYYLYKCTTAGIPGNTQPVWPTSGTVTDGQVVWTYSTTYACQIGTALGINYGTGMTIGAAIASQARYYNACMDFAQATFSNGSLGAVLRMSANQVIDFSAFNTLAAQNKRTLGYVSSTAAWTYQYNGAPIIQAFDTGTVKMPSQALTYAYVYPITSGGSATAATGQSRVFLGNPSTLAAYTVVFPAAPQDGQEFSINAGAAVTALTCSGNGASVSGAPAGLTANVQIKFMYVQAYNFWARLQ